jgi:uncharacterized membrane protein
VKRSRYVAQAGVIAAVYAAFTLVVIQNPLGYGPVQVRLSEALTVIALFTPAAIPGLALGSVVANSFMLASFPLAWLDVIFGSLATLVAAAWTWRFRERRGFALAGPVVVNALVIPAYLPIMLASAGFYRLPALGIDVQGHWFAMYLFGVIAVLIGQSIAVYGLGLPLAALLKKAGADQLAGD